MTLPLEIRDLSVTFGALGRTPGRAVAAVAGVSLSLEPGRVLGILGESGSGKSALLRAAMGLLPPSAQLGGSVRVGGTEVIGASEATLRRLRGRQVAMVFQDPMTGFDPCWRVGEQVAEAVAAATGTAGRAARARVRELLSLVQVPDPERCARAFPHELSGGLRQRCMIAMALAGDPALLLADEPTTALDVSVQMQVLRLLRRIQRQRGMAVVFVTHDIGVVREVADAVAVMYAGRVVEQGPLARVLDAPAHPYTAGLLRSTVTLAHRGRPTEPIPGEPPVLDPAHRGCAFAPRCPRAGADCAGDLALAPVEAGHLVRCLRPLAAPVAAAAG